MLGEILAGTVQFGEILRVQRFEREEQHRLWEEEWRLRELREEARKKEEAKQRAFRAEVEKWNLCRMMREYIDERKHALDTATLEPELKQRALECIAWAKQYVERIDPLKEGFEIAQTTESQSGGRLAGEGRIQESPGNSINTTRMTGPSLHHRGVGNAT